MNSPPPQKKRIFKNLFVIRSCLQIQTKEYRSFSNSKSTSSVLHTVQCTVCTIVQCTLPVRNNFQKIFQPKLRICRLTFWRWPGRRSARPPCPPPADRWWRSAGTWPGPSCRACAAPPADDPASHSSPPSRRQSFRHASASPCAGPACRGGTPRGWGSARSSCWTGSPSGSRKGHSTH